MTLIEAINIIEQELANLNLEDRFGTLPVEEVFGIVGRTSGNQWDQCLDDLEKGKINPAEYAIRMAAMIRQYSSMKYRKRILRKLSNLKLDQTELDLI